MCFLLPSLLGMFSSSSSSSSSPFLLLANESCTRVRLEGTIEITCFSLICGRRTGWTADETLVSGKRGGSSLAVDGITLYKPRLVEQVHRVLRQLKALPVVCFQESVRVLLGSCYLELPCKSGC